MKRQLLEPPYPDLKLTTPPEPDEEPQWDDPQGCQAIVAVGSDGDYVMLRKPNLWMFDVEKRPQDNGFGESFDDLAPGVYLITYSYHTHRDWESGHIDDWTFEPEKIELLWQPASPALTVLKAVVRLLVKRILKLP